jgi:penicillin V acylase-like amidase (Ntn superfamily)
MMPFKSAAQRRKFAELLVQGKISPETYEEWNRETGSKKLPERVKPKRRVARAAVVTRSAAKRKTPARARRQARKKSR